MSYYLMNKDRILVTFEIKLNSLGQEKIVLISQQDKLFNWIKDLNIFIIKRKAPKQREHIKELMTLYKCNTISGFLDVTHALSLNDTLWVKRADDKNLQWDKVSLYKNKFNSVIAKTAFSGGMYGNCLSDTSPEFSTNGTFAKCWIRENDTVKLLKKGSNGYANSGLEPYSEFYASQIIDAMKIKHVDYTLASRKKEICSKCDLFTSEEYGFVPYSAFKFNSLEDLVNTYKTQNNYQFISDMLAVDAIILNEDRHLGNFGFLFDNDTGKIIDNAPLFDHNLSLLCYAMQSDFDNINQYLSVKGHKLDDNMGDFIRLAKAVMTPITRKHLKNIRGFKFIKHRRYNLPDWRLEALNKIVNNQIDRLLE